MAPPRNKTPKAVAGWLAALRHELDEEACDRDSDWKAYEKDDVRLLLALAQLALDAQAHVYGFDDECGDGLSQR